MTLAEDPATRTALIEAARAAMQSIFRSSLGISLPDWIQLELPIGQVKTLMAVSAQEGLNVSALAELLRIGKPAASILVDRLVQQGYVERTEDSEDRRRTLLALTSAGNELVATLRQGAGESHFVRWLEQMDAGDLAALTRGLRALAAIAIKESGTAPPSCASR
jgi:MarR family transcriptional regulator, organic hydroperoxide resistance regulator